MSHGLQVVTTTVVALGVVAAAVVYGRDAQTFVSPPEMVAEQFTRNVATKRYDRALQYVARDSGITAINLRLARRELQQAAGAVNNVEGEPGAIDGDRATASAVLFTENAGRIRYSFRFAKRRGVWKIVEWREDQRAADQP